MTITFKNVGQGDSIVIQWEDDGQERICIIDCNILGRTNPVIEHLRSITDLKEIEFILLSHPHADHYSGMEELLAFCDKNNIQINYFLHTCQSVPEYLRIATVTNYEADTLGSLFKFAQKLHKAGRINNFGHLNAGAPGDYTFNSRWAMRILSPSHEEISAFNKLVHKPAQLKDGETYRSNLLSTVIKIYDKNTHVLLTSDAEQAVFKRILRRSSGQFTKSMLILGQASHHGALTNYFEKFWKNQAYIQACPMAISVGSNGYGHPSEDVTSSLVNMGYHVVTTSGVTTGQSMTEILLDSMSTAANSGKDLVYRL